MLLGNKKTQGEEQNWCIVLSPIRNEIDKKRVAQKISEVFSLSLQEASDVVANTPIILLDQLTHAIASKIKDYFRSSGAEMILTNDTFLKRKCYRTVWPEPPNLSFLRESEASHQVPTPVQEKMEPDEALNEIRNLTQEDTLPNRQEYLLEEVERWKKECLVLNEESARLREEIEKLHRQRVYAGQRSGGSVSETATFESGKEMREIKAVLSDVQEKHDILKEEYRQARSIFEEKIAGLRRELHAAEKGAEPLKEEIQQLREDNERLGEALRQKEVQAQRFQEEFEKFRDAQEDRFSELSQEAKSRQLQVEQLQPRIDFLTRSKEELESQLGQGKRLAFDWQKKYEEALLRLEQTQKDSDHVQLQKASLDQWAKDIERKQERLLEELEARSEEARDWEGKFLEIGKTVAALKNQLENQERILGMNSQQLESRDRELAASRRQLEELTRQLEHRQEIEKRTRLANQLVQKEAHFKGLVKEQGRIEDEIREREAAIRKILAEQETVEKEILEARQAERQLPQELRPEGGSEPRPPFPIPSA